MMIIKTKPNLRSRLIAGLIDYGIITIYIVIMFIFFGVKNQNNYTITGLPAFSVMVIWCLYFIGSELLFGRTLGNYAVYLKPISIINNERELNFIQPIQRHLFDMVDLFIFGLIAYILIKNTLYHQRIGDIWAHTIVIDTTDSEQGIFFE